jgi:hypothetical protein
MQAISIAIRNFNDRVKQMNQTNSKQLVLSADEARNLHTDIFSLLNNLSEVVAAQSAQNTKEKPLTSMSLDGGAF